MNMDKGIDLIGDIHGHAAELKALLKKLGYSYRNKSFRHPERTALFVGDYIDRGPENPEALDIVRRMTDSGSAIAIMGNHEYNLLCFHYENENGGHLREHSIKNILQHSDVFKQFEGRQKEYEEYLDWFLTLPLYYESEGFRAVHACWDGQIIKTLRGLLKNDRLTEKLLYKSADKDHVLNHAINQILKGKEIELPEGSSYKDQDNNERTEIRIKWWENPAGQTYESIAVKSEHNLPDEPITDSGFLHSDYYDESQKPVFFGHYWLEGEPSLYRHNICCLDFSIADGGKLAAYRFDGEKKLRDEKLVYV